MIKEDPSKIPDLPPQHPEEEGPEAQSPPQSLKLAGYDMTDLRLVAEPGWRVLRIARRADGGVHNSVRRLVGWATVDWWGETWHPDGKITEHPQSHTDTHIWHPVYWLNLDADSWSRLVTDRQDMAMHRDDSEELQVLVVPPGAELGEIEIHSPEWDRAVVTQALTGA